MKEGKCNGEKEKKQGRKMVPQHPDTKGKVLFVKCTIRSFCLCAWDGKGKGRREGGGNEVGMGAGGCRCG